MLLGCDQLIINTKYFFEITSIIFPENTEQYVMLCCRCQHVKFSRLYNPEGNGRTANPLHVSAGNMRNPSNSRHHYNRVVVKAAGRAFMRFVTHLMLLCLLCCALCLFFAEHCLFSDMLFHVLFMPKQAKRNARIIDKGLCVLD